MKSRVAAGVVAIVTAVGLVGCSGAAPKPSPTPTPPFASADAAYKAAEATYRAYVDAGNHVNLADDETFKPVYAWLLGDALKTDRQELTAMAAKGWKLGGSYRVAAVEPLPSADSDPLWGDVHLAACLDVSRVHLSDASGKSVVSTSRPDVIPVKVALSRDGSTPTGMKIVKIEDRNGSPACTP